MADINFISKIRKKALGSGPIPIAYKLKISGGKYELALGFRIPYGWFKQALGVYEKAAGKKLEELTKFRVKKDAYGMLLSRSKFAMDKVEALERNKVSGLKFVSAMIVDAFFEKKDDHQTLSVLITGAATYE